MNYADEFQEMSQAYELAGGELTLLQSDEVARLVVSGSHVVSKNQVPGVQMRSEAIDDGVRIWLKVGAGTTVAKPIHLCFGLIPREGRQVIVSDYEIGEGAKVEFVSHCTFPNAVAVTHEMEAQIRIRAGARMIYNEVHYHGPAGGVVARPKTRATIGPGGQLFSSFKTVEGQVGELDIDFAAELDASAVAEFTTKVYGKGEDRVRVREILTLKGAAARGLTKTNIVVIDRASSDVHTEMHGLAPHTRGHMDCTEVVAGRAVARNVPVVLVSNETAKVTHEAAIGSVDRRQVETLMARGLSEEEAVDVVVQGLLR